MAAKIFSCSFTGLKCQIIEVEADISNGLPSFSIVGLGDASVQESKERVRSSIKNSGATFPTTKKTINLAPAEIRKQGSLFDLPIAISILLASGQLKSDNIQDSVIIGELSLNGKIKKINGTLPITQHAKEKGFKRIFLPKENAIEAGFIEGIEIYPLDNLREYIEFCSNHISIQPFPHVNFQRFQQNIKKQKKYTLTRIIGLEDVKRSLSIAATGGHNILLTGPPGTGKTILARAFAEMVPEMSKNEILETTKIFSVAGMLESSMPLITNRPFREVHHTASIVSIIGGGGHNPKPGEISLAHNGVLFFDEIAEFPSQVLESLRQPLEDKFINISRANFSIKFPSNFIFVATMNPCPCGYKDDKKIKCICADYQIQNYQKKLSGPILDRFDIFQKVLSISMKNIFEEESNEKEMELHESIKNAKERQNERFKNEPHINKNSDMTMEEIKKYCYLKKETNDFLNHATEKLNLSTRGYLRVLKVARTIADLDQSDWIKYTHIAEALHYRTN